MTQSFREILKKSKERHSKKQEKQIEKKENFSIVKELGFKNEEDYFNWCVQSGFHPSLKKTENDLKIEKITLRKDMFDLSLHSSNEIKKINPLKLLSKIKNNESLKSDDFVSSFKVLFELNNSQFEIFVKKYVNNKKFYDSKNKCFSDYKGKDKGTVYIAIYNILNNEEYWIRDINDWKPIKSKKSEVVIISLIQHLFFKYEMPKFLCSIFFNEKLHKENSLFQTILQIGKTGSFKKCLKENKDLPLLTNKEYNELFRFNQLKVFERTFNAIYLKNRIKNKNIIAEYELSEKGNKIPNDFLVSFLLYIDEQTMFDITQMWPLYDYILHKKREYENENKVFQFKGRALYKLMREMENWHRELGKNKTDFYWEKNENIYDYKYEYINKNTDYVEGVVIIEELTSSHDLRKEGRALNHCVASYARSCKKGVSSIFSYKEKAFEDKFKNVLTIEVRNNNVVQVRGKNNRMPTEAEKNHVSNWKKKNNLF